MSRTLTYTEGQLQRIQLNRLGGHGLKVTVNPNASEVTLIVPEEGVSVDDLLGTLVVDGAGSAFDTSGMPTEAQNNVTSNGGIVMAPMRGSNIIDGEVVPDPTIYGSGATQKTVIYPSGTTWVTVKRESIKEIILIQDSREPQVTLELRSFDDSPILIEADEMCIWT